MAMGDSRAALAAAFLAVALSSADACIYLFGNAKDSLAAPTNGTKWNHGFLGDDWDGKDGTGKPWSCMTGTLQSPINIASVDPRAAVWDSLHADVSILPSQLMTHWNYPPLVSNGSNLQVINTGHTIQVEWDTKAYGAEVTIAAPENPDNSTTVTAVLNMTELSAATRVPIVPIQFHFHAHSEHMLADSNYPLELHIVHSVTDPKLPGCAAGCFSVTGVLFEIDPLGANNTALEAIWKYMPMREGQKANLPAGASIPLSSLLPTTSRRDYVTYSGSLTTPPCSEGLLWHVMTHTQKMSLAQWRQYMTAVGVKNCTSNSAGDQDEPDHHHHRRLLSDGHQSLSLDPATRRLTAEGGNPGNYTCKVVGYGWNYRLPQPLNERKIRMAKQGCDQSM